MFNGLGMNLGNLSRLSHAKSRSISAENFTGEKGRGGMATEGTGAMPARGLGRGWKVSPSVEIQPGECFTMADIEGPGAIQQIWLTPLLIPWHFCGSYDFDSPITGQYQDFCTPYAGLHQVIRPDGHYSSQQRFGMYRWHIMDPVRFEQDLRVTIQVLGWRKDRRYLPLQDDVATVAYWYQTLPTAPFPALPDRDYLEII